MTSTKDLSPTPARPVVPLSSSLDKGLLGYATAATAAGVSLFALAHPAEAKIVYTPANIPITVNGPPVQVDLNHDGIIDFSIFNFAGTCEAKGIHKLGCSFASFYIVGVQNGNAIGSSQTFNGAQCAAILHPARSIGPSKKFKATEAELFGDFATSAFFASDCPWTGRGNPGGFLGLKFVVGSDTFYGWAMVSLTTKGPVLAGYAYENTPGAPIKAGAIKGADSADASHAPVFPDSQPAGLGVLALGTPGLSLWRREELNN